MACVGGGGSAAEDVLDVSEAVHQGVHLVARIDRERMLSIYDAYRAAPDSAGHFTLVVLRRSSASYRGWSARGDDTTWVTGRASGELRYRVDATSGAPASASGTASLDVEVRSGTTRQRATQVSVTRIARLAP